MASAKAPNLCCGDSNALPAGAQVNTICEISCEQLASLAWAIAHPARVKIMSILINKQSRICGEIVEQLPLAQSTVSQHLKILKESGLVQGEVDGPKVCYCVNPAKLKELKVLIASL